LPFGIGVVAADFGGFDAPWGDRIDSLGLIFAKGENSAIENSEVTIGRC
jgi:hypothetical protein